MRSYTQIDALGNEFISDDLPHAVWLEAAWVPWTILRHYPEDVTLSEIEDDIRADVEQEVEA